jgi:endogenous inhibitor of DNA gyrase (YacG/DUF329 family)
MQHKSNPVRLAETLAQTTAPVFGLFNRRQFEIAAARRLAAADFYSSYYSLFVFSLFLALLAQVASLVSAYGYFEGVLSVKLSGHALTVAAGLAVVLLEVAKYFVMNRVFADLFRLAGMRIPYGLAVIAVGISALSIWASIQGGGNMAVNPQAIEQAASPFAAEAAILRQEIADIKNRNTWKGKIWIAGADKKLLHQKEAQLARVLTGRDQATAKAEAKEAMNVQTYQYAFSGFELVFIICTLWAWYFRRRVAVEAESQYLTEKTTEGREAQSQPLPYEQPKATPRNIGFTFAWQQANETGNNETGKSNPTSPIHAKKITNESGNNETGKSNPTSPIHAQKFTNQSGKETPTMINVQNTTNQSGCNVFGLRTCKHCGKSFERNHKVQQYCSKSCKVAAWELRTGKKFIPRNKAKSPELTLFS